MRLLISPGNVHNAKSYPHWTRLLELVQDCEIEKIEGILSEPKIIELVNWCDVWVSIDSFLPHLVNYYKLKPGIVLWGKSDPLIFGYPGNTNLLKDRKYLRKDQFGWWKIEPVNPDVFVSPEVILQEIGKYK